MKFLPILAALALGACTAAQTAQGQAVAAQLCAYDAQLQPIAGAIIATAAPGAAPAVTVDNALIHPAVVAACGTVAKPQ